MWYVIHTISGNEHEVCMWINSYVDKSLYRRCFVPLYEDVWRKQGIGHISIKKMFAGYIFLDTDTPEAVYEELKGVSQLSNLLSVKDKEGRIFIPIHRNEEVFLDSVLSDGMMKVSYIRLTRNGRIGDIIGPLQSYEENIVRIDMPHRRAIVKIPMLGEDKRVKFGLWLDIDPKITWIEVEKRNRIQRNAGGTVVFEGDTGQTIATGGSGNNSDHTCPANPWDWKEWKKINEEKKKNIIDDEIYGYKVGDYVINTTGIYGDTPLEIVEIRPGKSSVVVNVQMFGNVTRIEMGIGEIEPKG